MAYMNPDNLLFEEKPMPKTLLYILSRCPPVAYWVGIFIFFKVSFMKHPNVHTQILNPLSVLVLSDMSLMWAL